MWLALCVALWKSAPEEPVQNWMHVFWLILFLWVSNHHLFTNQESVSSMYIHKSMAHRVKSWTFHSSWHPLRIQYLGSSSIWPANLACLSYYSLFWHSNCLKCRHPLLSLLISSQYLEPYCHHILSLTAPEKKIPVFMIPSICSLSS